MIRAVKGTRDLLPPDTAVWNRVERIAREVFRAYNYHEIRTPILEETQLFARGVGAETDIVSKEMYTFEDRDGSSLTLRPENTASVIRAYIEHRLDQRPGVQKLYYIGPMFRRERPQKGRYRQFFQIGAEAIGSESPFVDAEVIEMVVEMLSRAGLTGFRLLINSVGDHNCRPAFVEKLREALKPVAPLLCEDCQRRAVTNPLRVLDCKVPEDQAEIDKLPSILDNLCISCGPHFDAVKTYLTDRGIEFEVKPRLVRGLDYYMRTTFEVTHGDLGAQNSVLGGGRYDGLAESLGSSVHSPGIGFSIGEDRLVMTVDPTNDAPLDIYIAPLGDAALRHAGELARELRRNGLSVEVMAGGKLKRAMELANKLGARYALILGDDEIAAGEYSLKDMASGEQRRVRREALLGALGTTSTTGISSAEAVELKEATFLGQKVKGSSEGSEYRCIAFNTRIKVAAKLVGLPAIRVEWTDILPVEKDKITESGLIDHGTHASIHWDPGVVPPARFIGGVLLLLGFKFTQKINSLDEAGL